MKGMDYHITLTIGLDRPIPDDVARDVAARWAGSVNAELGMTSTARDEGWLRVAATSTDTHYPGGRGLADHAEAELLHEVRRVGLSVQTWHAVEVLTDDETVARARHRGVPPLVDAQTLADLCDVKRQRVYQWVSDRPAGFPAQVVTGWWLRAEAEHWAATRPTRTGPRPARDAS